MSLLLEALNKSESEYRARKHTHDFLLKYRELATESNLESEENIQSYQPASGFTVVNTNNQMPWMFIMLACNVLLFAIFWFFWLQTEKHQNSQSVMLLNHLANQSKKENAVSTTTENVDLARLVMEEAESILQNIAKQPESNVVNEESLSVAKAPTAPPSKIPVSAKVSPLSIKPRQELYQLHELPPDLATNFPQFTYNGHLYSSDLPSARMLMVNDTQYYEKDFINKDVQIDQITHDGVIYNFNDIKLQVDVVSQLQ